MECVVAEHRQSCTAIEARGATLFCNFLVGVPNLDPLYNASSQVFRIRLSHSMLASSPVGSLNHDPRFMGIPDSIFPQNADTAVARYLWPIIFNRTALNNSSMCWPMKCSIRRTRLAVSLG